MIKSFLYEITRPIIIVYYFATTLIFGVAGPFGTYQGSGLFLRLGFWGWVCGLALIIALIVRVFYLRVIGPQSFWLREVFCISTFTIVFSPVLWQSILWAAPDRALIPLNFIGTFAFVMMVAIISVALEQVITGPRKVEDGKAGDGKVDDAAPGSPKDLLQPQMQRPPLLDRISADKHGKILKLQARNHYVDVTTDNGQEPVLIRLADAIALLDGVEGTQVHRSYWVARSAVAGSERREGRLFLTLENGDEIPVSRSFRPTVERSLL